MLRILISCNKYAPCFHGLDSDNSCEPRAFSKGPGKRGHIVADTLLPMMFLGLRKVGNICCGHKMFLNKTRNIFVSGHKICVRNKCCARGQTGTHLCRQQCVRNSVSSFARALSYRKTRDGPLFSRGGFLENETFFLTFTLCITCFTPLGRA